MLLSGQGFQSPGHCDLDLWPADPNINGIIYDLANYDTHYGYPKRNSF